MTIEMEITTKHGVISKMTIVEPTIDYHAESMRLVTLAGKLERIAARRMVPGLDRKASKLASKLSAMLDDLS